MAAKKEERQTEKKRKGKDDRMLIRSDWTHLNLIFCSPEWTEEKWHSQGSYGYMNPPLYMQSLQVTMDWRQRVVVVCGIRKFIMARGQGAVVNFT
jgi:hypothetical protein